MHPCSTAQVAGTTQLPSCMHLWYIFAHLQKVSIVVMRRAGSVQLPAAPPATVLLLLPAEPVALAAVPLTVRLAPGRSPRIPCAQHQALFKAQQA